MSHLPLLQTIQDTLVETLSAARDAERIGGFVYLHSPGDSLKWLNQSIPVAPCAPADVRRLIQRYQETQREPWLEFFLDLSPDVPPMLEAEGLVRIQDMPIMVLPRDEWLPARYDHQARIASQPELQPGLEALAEAFGNPVDSGGVWESICSGRALAAVGFSEHQVVAMGQAVGNAEIREVAGIGTRPSFRRRGYASAVIHCLLDQFFSAGGDVAWLTPGDDGAESVYQRCGFRTGARQVCYGIPEGYGPDASAPGPKTF